MRFLADENFNNNIVRGLLLRDSTIDIVRAFDVGLAGRPDPDVLQFAADQGQVVLSHDVATLVGFAFERVRRGLPMPGLIEAPESIPIGAAIEDLLLIARASLPDELGGRVIYLPLR